MEPIWACNWEAECCWYSPDGKSTSNQCFQGEVPLLAVNATKAEHVQRAVAWAAERNILLSVKSTGHDYMGRSTSSDTLNIWVHYMKDATYFESWDVCGNKP